MAIVQISRIQVRRGRKGTNNIPQLASGEFGWAVDSQELFIGNGSVSEGAPAVGNTRILTEKSNIFDLVSQYQYKKNDPVIQTGFSPASPVSRTLQDRLDDTVSIRSFLTPEDIASNDYSDAIQRALDQLYLNDATKGTAASRIVLEFEAGVYTISKTIYIPPFARLVGAGKDKTVIQGADIIVAATIGDDASAGEDHSLYGQPNAFDILVCDQFLNQPRYIEIDGITFKSSSTTKTVFEAKCLRNSRFNDVKFQGGWTSGTAPEENNNGISLIAFSSAVTCKENFFNNCDFEDVAYGVDSTYDIEHCIFRGCVITRCFQGVTFGWTVSADPVTAITYGPRYCKVEQTRFHDIEESAIQLGNRTGAPDSKYCYGNISQSNTFSSIGGGSNLTNDSTPVIEFLASGNLSSNDFFERSFDLTPATTADPYKVGDFSGFTNADHKYLTKLSINSSPNATVMRFPGNVTAGYKIHYYYTNQTLNIIRKGILSVNVDINGSRAHLSDEFDGIGDLSLVEDLRFRAELQTGVGAESCDIEYSSTQDDGTLTYWYEVMGQ